MSTAKTKIDDNTVLSFIRENFATRITDLSRIEGGEGSQAFSFLSEKGAFVVRVHTNDRGFQKDKYAYEHFNSTEVPIPMTELIDRFNDSLVVSISRLVPGFTLDKFAEEEWVLPQLFKTMDYVHAVDISKSVGFGEWSEHGDAPRRSWREYLEHFEENFQKLDVEKLGLYLSREVIDTVLASFSTLVVYCPEIRCLVHGDMEFDNVLGENGHVTGVIDWDLSKYGDFLYDGAWLSFWKRKYDIDTMLRRHYEAVGKEIEHFDERMRCYKLLIGLASIWFFSHSEQEEKYNRTLSRLETFI